MTNEETKLAKVIQGRADALLEDLKLHVGLPTGGCNTEALSETRQRLVERLVALGARIELIPGDPKPNWLLGGGDDVDIPPTAICSRTRGREGQPRILIAGHLDTVHDPEGDFRALSISDDGTTAVGPGCVDMKGGLVIAVAALEALDEVGLDASWTFLMNSDEETGSYHSERALSEQAQRHDIGLALEPALPGGELVVERMGSGQFYIETRGRSAHVGRAFSDGVSAVTALAKCLVHIGEMADMGRIINVGPIQGGSVTNAVPDLACAWGNTRYPTPQAADEIAAMLDEMITESDALPAVRVERSFNRPAKPLIEGTQRLADAARDAAESLGQKLPFAKTGGVCDGNILQSAGLPTIDTLGVRGGGLHTKDEWIELPSLVERCQLLAVLIHRLTQRGIRT